MGIFQHQLMRAADMVTPVTSVTAAYQDGSEVRLGLHGDTSTANLVLLPVNRRAQPFTPP